MKYIICIIVLILIVSVSCKNSESYPDTGKNEIYYIGSDEYENAVGKLKISLDEARLLLAKYVKKEKNFRDDTKEIIINKHYILINNQYLFSWLDKQGRISLAGYYVDGITGNVTKKFSRGAVSISPELLWELNQKVQDGRVLLK